VCVCVSVHHDISRTTRAIFTKCFVHVAYGGGSVLLWSRCDTLYSSGFVDNIMFFYNGQYSVINFAMKD